MNMFDELKVSTIVEDDAGWSSSLNNTSIIYIKKYVCHTWPIWHQKRFVVCETTVVVLKHKIKIEMVWSFFFKNKITIFTIPRNRDHSSLVSHTIECVPIRVSQSPSRWQWDRSSLRIACCSLLWYSEDVSCHPIRIGIVVVICPYVCHKYLVSIMWRHPCSDWMMNDSSKWSSR